MGTTFACKPDPGNFFFYEQTTDFLQAVERVATGKPSRIVNLGIVTVIVKTAYLFSTVPSSYSWAEREGRREKYSTDLIIERGIGFSVLFNHEISRSLV